MVAVFANLIFLALTAAAGYTAFALLHFSSGHRIAFDTLFRRFWGVWIFGLVGGYMNAGLPWGPFLDCFWCFLLMVILDLPAAVGARFLTWIFLVGVVKRLTLAGIMALT